MATHAEPIVLLVEDEASIAEPFARALGREGFSPVVAGTAADARALFAGRRPNIVLLDLGLPDGDGREPRPRAARRDRRRQIAGVVRAGRPRARAGRGDRERDPGRR